MRSKQATARREDFINRSVADTISYYDYAEGISTMALWLLYEYRRLPREINRESGNGRPDIVMTESKFRGSDDFGTEKISDTIRGMEKVRGKRSHR